MNPGTANPSLHLTTEKPVEHTQFPLRVLNSKWDFRFGRTAETRTSLSLSLLLARDGADFKCLLEKLRGTPRSTSSSEVALLTRASPHLNNYARVIVHPRGYKFRCRCPIVFIASLTW